VGWCTVNRLSLVLDPTNFSRINRDWSRSRTQSAQHRELNFGWCLLEGAPSPGSSSDATESSCRPFCPPPPSFYQVPWADGRLKPSPLQPPVRSLQWSLQGVDLLGPPCRLHRHPQSQILMTTGRLDLLLLPGQPGCDLLYPERDPNRSPLAH
jgi:hypothetical protein